MFGKEVASRSAVYFDTNSALEEKAIWGGEGGVDVCVCVCVRVCVCVCALVVFDVRVLLWACMRCDCAIVWGD
jgi:hypothetical protein